MTHFGLMLLCLFAFASLALGMERHQFDLMGRALPPATTRWLRLLGWSLLSIALFVAVRGQGWSMGLVSYSGHTGLGAGLVFIALVAHGRRQASCHS